MMNEKKMPWGHISIENTTILPGGWRNFGGRASRFNAQGSRFCTIRIDDFDLAEQLISEGWLVKPVMSRNPDVTEPEYYTLKLKIKVYDDSMPDIWVIVSNKKRKLNAESLAMLDTADIISADLEILGRPTLLHEGQPDEKMCYSARIKEAYIVLAENRFSQKYADYESDDQGTELSKLPF